ncbi:MAG: alkanesulfonate monooxygenase SsuD [Gammaproteobacteria bacterium]|jgi:alkanesulfonate monooxygenase SsuD/methylene tetrahydromethanopterin reductase-like flavin-dependent oxidoreductase (luciferase family)
MEFGIIFPTRIGDWRLIADAEALGYDRAWVPDSQMIWSDCYATLALAAEHTSRIKIGTGVSIPRTRIAPVTAHSIATINQLAPGRVFLGLGTGHTAMRVMGMQPQKIDAFREYLRVVRALLRGEEVDYTLDGVTRPIRFLHPDQGFRELMPEIPIYIAANGPRALAVTGEYGDGLTTLLYEDPTVLQDHSKLVKAGAERAGRRLPDPFHLAAVSSVVVLRAGETLASKRVVDACGAWVTTALHFVYEVYAQTGREEVIPEGFRDNWEQYCAYVENMETPADRRYLQLHEGHSTYLVEAERQFVTPAAIEGTSLVGSASEIIERIRAAERAGMTELTILPPTNTSRENLSEFAARVMKRY